MDSLNEQPNILFLFSDQHRADIFSHTGHPDIQTPHLDQLAAESVRFDRAYCQNGICAPSRASMMTGQYCRSMKFFNNNTPDLKSEDYFPFPQILQNQGYKTAAFGKRHLPPVLDMGWDVTATTMVDHDLNSDEFYLDWVTEKGQRDAFARDWQAEFGIQFAAPMASRLSDLEPENTMEAYTAKKTIDFLRNHKDSKQPFLVWSSFYRPHQPYTPVKKYADIYDLDKLTLPKTLYESPDQQPPGIKALRKKEDGAWCIAQADKDEHLWRKYIGYYYALVTEIDHHVGEILKTLEEEGLADNTIVIYSSDHGDFVGAHGIVSKASPFHNMYEDTLRVPLLIKWPKRIKPYISQDLVELIDIYPTLLDITGIGVPKNLPGNSLVPALINQEPVKREFAFSENNVQMTAIGDRYKLSVWLEPQKGNYTDVLFDREIDPLETHNIISRPEVAGVEQVMRKSLSDWSRRYSL